MVSFRPFAPFSLVLALLFPALVVGCSEPATPTAGGLSSPSPTAIGVPTTVDSQPAAPGTEVGTEVEAKKDSGLPEAAEETGTDAAVGLKESQAKNEASQAQRDESLSKSAEAKADADAQDKPRSVLILGDSLAATGFGAVLERRLDAHPGIHCYRKGKSASGLARPDFFDWMGEASRQVELRDPELVIVIMGGNDGQDLTQKRKGKRVGWKSSGWEQAYRERMDTFLAKISGQNRGVLWLGLPKTNTVKFEAKLELIRAIQRDAVGALGTEHRYLNTTTLLLDEEGQLLRTIKAGRKTRKLRADDGIHFTMSGSTYFADKVYPEVLNALGIQHVDP